MSDKYKLDKDANAPSLGVSKNMGVPIEKISKDPVNPRNAYMLVKDELLNEGNARQNLATFCQTYMIDEASKLMSETMDKNAIDKSEYPRTAELEKRCVNIIADLWNANPNKSFIGTSTVGSSEACMLGGMAMKFRWREMAKSAGVDINAKKPNLVITSGYQVCWKKFCVYWDIELRAVPMDEDNLSLNPDKLLDYVDEYTIGVVGLLGITYTGKFDDIKGLDAKLEEYNAEHDIKVYMHIDGASGGLFTPFVNPELEWDFRLKNVVSINTSGHKYGLVYPGIGWIVWRDKKFLPEELIFEVNYLGGELPTIAINFSHSASHIIGQYYNFLRLGYDGYREIHTSTRDVATYISSELEKTGMFYIYNDGYNLPIVCYRLKDDVNREWNLYELADRLLMKGWQVPAYPLPDNLSDIVIQRIVVRSDLGMNTAHAYIEDLKSAIDDLDNARILYHDKDEIKTFGFTH
ncbi:MAG: glutamate decarboxylase [Peptostreptococcus sp.]|uniref:glutamate decarboxylase n=1 Tax=Peptostreptococcus sp. TaxID=1262 RepID=UPI002FC84F1D